MSTIITRTADAATTTPDLVMLHEDASEAASVVHPIIGSEDVDVTLRPARRPTGTLRLLYLTHADATAARELHRAASTFTIDSPDMPWLPARYVPQGAIGRVQQAQNVKRWMIEVGYQELAP